MVVPSNRKSFVYQVAFAVFLSQGCCLVLWALRRGKETEHDGSVLLEAVEHGKGFVEIWSWCLGGRPL